MATPRSESDRDTSADSRARPRQQRVLGLTMIGGGLLLLISVFLPWGHVAIGGPQAIMTASVSGTGTVTVSVGDGDASLEHHVADYLNPMMNHLGWWVLVIAVLIVVAGAFYLWSPARLEAAIVVTVLGAIGAAMCLFYAVHIRESLSEALDVSSGDGRPGYGVVLACILTVLLTALGFIDANAAFSARGRSRREKGRVG
ncbi:hypothetical protein FOS14_05180 [Skermania sp. ID1734]|uniref:hypothetical protein n=1 Tax=Skermania sp. ID1734 TaxID=2597516 RepID=UPI00118130E5|nr:hypothetical protein [Skermania sp. ID1734]TSE01138.1 hypothetical protein FOS14_05180 [Skermania sp. ID1734]